MFYRLVLLSFPISIILYYIIPFIFFQENIEHFFLLIGLLLAYLFGLKFPIKFNFEVRQLISDHKRDKYILIGAILAHLIFYYNNDGFLNLFRDDYRNWYYVVNDQWNTEGWFYKINQYVAMLTLFFSSYCGWIDGKNRTYKIGSLLWVSLGVLGRFALGSRFFILHLIIYFFSYFIANEKKIKKSKIYYVLIIAFVSIYYGFSIRFGDSGASLITPLISSLNGLKNLDIAVNSVYSNNFSFSFFLYHWTPLPSFLFNIPDTNLTILKYGHAEGSSEPMPLIASIFYLQGYYSLIYLFLLGSLVSGVVEQWKINKTFLSYFLMVTVLYMVVIYHNHSSWRASSRFFIWVITFKIFLKFMPLIGYRFRRN